MAILGGVLVGRFYRLIDDALRRGQDQRAALCATYFSCSIFPWLNGGGIVVMFHVSLLAGFGLTLWILDVLKPRKQAATANSARPASRAVRLRPHPDHS